MKNKIGYLGLLGIPLAVLGIAGSVAFAQTNTPPAQNTPPVQTQQSTIPDTDNIQDQTNDATPDTAIDANDVETPKTGATATNEAPGGHEDVGANADHQFEGME